MGKMTIVIVIGLALIVVLIGNTINRANKAVIENLAGHEKRAIARNLAHAGVNKALRSIDAKDTSLINPVQLGQTVILREEIMGGVCSVWVNRLSGIDTLVVAARAHYMDSVVAMNLRLSGSALFPVGGCLVSSANTKMNLYTSNEATFDGNSYTMAGLPDAGCTNIHGLTFGEYGDVTYTTSGILTITGTGGGTRDTAKDPGIIDYKPITDKLKTMATRVIPGGNYSKADTFGTIAKPQITWCKSGYVNSAPITGAGILVVDSKFKANQTFDFWGMIFVVGDTINNNNDCELTNVNKFFGTIIATGPQTRLRTSNKPVLRYSCEALELAWELLGAGENYDIISWYE